MDITSTKHKLANLASSMEDVKSCWGTQWSQEVEGAYKKESEKMQDPYFKKGHLPPEFCHLSHPPSLHHFGVGSEQGAKTWPPATGTFCHSLSPTRREEGRHLSPLKSRSLAQNRPYSIDDCDDDQWTQGVSIKAVPILTLTLQNIRSYDSRA